MNIKKKVLLLVGLLLLLGGVTLVAFTNWCAYDAWLWSAWGSNGDPTLQAILFDMYYSANC